jgi:hypothetical protein
VRGRRAQGTVTVSLPPGRTIDFLEERWVWFRGCAPKCIDESPGDPNRARHE